MFNRCNHFRVARVASALLTVTAFLSSRHASAALVINLAFPNGSTSMSLSAANAGQDIPILVYGTVTGANAVTQTPGATSGDFDGIQYAYYNVISSVGSHGGITGGIDSGATDSSKQPALNGATGADGNYGYGFNNEGSQVGSVQDVNGDGIADLGSLTNSLQVAKPRCYPSIYDNAGSGAFGAVNPTGAPNIIIGGANNNSVSFLLETLYFHVGSSPAAGQSTSFNPVPFSLPFPYYQTNYFVDDPSTFTAGSRYTFQTESAGTPVTFTVASDTPVPEPASAIGVAGFAIAGLCRRRWRV